jgi:predicted phage-related endonuclease
MFVKDNEKMISMFDVSLDVDSSYSNEEIDLAVAELSRIKRQIKLLQDNEKELSAKVKEFINDKEKLVGIDGTIIATYTKHEGVNRVDNNILKASYPEAYYKCLVQGESYRRFLIK